MHLTPFALNTTPEPSPLKQVSDNTAEEVADDSKALAAQQQEAAAVKTALAAHAALRSVRTALRGAVRENAAWAGEGARVQQAPPPTSHTPHPGLKSMTPHPTP